VSVAAALRDRGHAVETLLAEDFSPAVRAGRRSRLMLPFAAARHISGMARRGIRFDAVVIHEPSALVYTLARRWNPTLPPCVVMSHGVEQRCWDLDAERMPRTLKARFLHPITELAQANYSLRHADAVVCLSSDDAQYLEKRLGVPAARIHRVNNGVNVEAFGAEWTPSTQPNLLFMGSWIPRKGTRELARMFAELRAVFPGLRCTVLGSGLRMETVLADFAEGDRAAVDVFPLVPREDLPGLLARDQIFVLPSHFEGMPLTLLEAMAAGLPCVTTNICGMRDVIEHRSNGILVQPGDSSSTVQVIEGLLRSTELRVTLGVAARNTARKLSWATVAETWELLLSELTDKTVRVSHQYDHWHRQVATRDDPEGDLDNPWHSFVRSQLTSIEGLTVVEAACGRGQLAAWLRRRGARTVGLDISFCALGIARDRLCKSVEGVALACGDVQSLPFRTGTADILISCETLEHVAEPCACLRELRRVLRPGGKLILTTENYLNIWGLYRLYIAARGRPFNSGDCPQPIEQWMFSTRTRRMVRQAGFRIVRTDGEGHHLFLLPGVNPPDLEARFVSRMRVLRRILRYFARHFFLLAEAV